MWIYPRIVAHRGGGTFAPENTLAGFKCALEFGFKAVEFDVMLAADGVAILMHDERFGRTISEKGGVADYASSQIQNFDAGSWFGQSYAKEWVPSFEAALDFCITQNVWPNIEIKPRIGTEAQTGRVWLWTWRVATHSHSKKGVLQNCRFFLPLVSKR